MKKLSLDKITGQRPDKKNKTYVPVKKEPKLEISSKSMKKLDNIKEDKWKY